ncbi:ead/Ea22-like family protein [Escherichia coli]|uniref:ead/Ea22-like family protein n=1 Tax=Escherichia coli TaxID=562 RepID=UPI003CCBC29A
MSNIDKQALNQEKIEWLNKLADMEYCKSNPGHWLMSLKDTNMLAKLALRSVALLDELEAAEKRIAELEAREIKPAKGEVLVVVSGFTGCGKSAIAGEIEIAMKAIGVPVKWINGDAEKRMTGADWLTAIEMYKPTVRIVEVNVPRAAGIRIKGE